MWIDFCFLMHYICIVKLKDNKIMRKIFITLSFILISFWSFSQSLSLYKNGTLIEDGAKITINANVDATIMYFMQETSVGVKNNTNDYVDVKVLKEQIDIVEGSECGFCWSQCYPPHVMVSSSSILLEENELKENEFYVEFWTNEKVGTSIVKFTFYACDDDGNFIEDDKVSIEYMFNIEPVGIENYIIANSSMQNARPNPASSYTNIPYTLPMGFNGNAQIVVKNILGATVFAENINGGSDKVYVNTSELEEGVYFYSMIINNKSAYTKKLIINK